MGDYLEENNNKKINLKILFIFIILLCYSLIPIYGYYFKPDIDKLKSIEVVQKGWVNIEKSGKNMWFYKDECNYKRGWYYDENYNAWYYFYDKTIDFPMDKLNATLMYDPGYESSRWLEINNLLYEFEIGGKLIEHSGWVNYSGKWMYYIPGDYGAYKDTTVEIDGIKYSFDSNGYLKNNDD